MSELELFPEPSPSESTVFSKTTKTNDFDPETESLLTELEVDNVRITPPCMHFENAFEGKRFKQKLTIQNCGKHLAFIRFCEPNSKVTTEKLHLQKNSSMFCRLLNSNLFLKAYIYPPE